ncbi:MAG: ComEC/Rec2 family competence protein, partial [Oceanobacter sp.]
MKGIALALGFSLMLGTRLSQQELIALLVSTAFCVLLVMAAKFLFPVWLGGLPTIGPMLLFLMAIAMGSVYGHGWLQDRLSSRLPTVQDRSEAKVIVQVTSLQEKSRWSRLELAVLCQERGSKLPQLKRLQLNYYEKSSQKGESELNAAPEVGQILQVHALLRAIRNFENGLAFDYEAYQLRRGIDARGHIKHLQSVELASLSEFENCNAGVVSRAQGSASKYLLEQRSQWIEQLESRLGSHAGLAKGWIMGLVFGEATAFTAEQWRLAQATGTLHLLVVSGLHLGAFALAAVGFSGFLARIIAFFGFSMGTGSRMLLRQLLIAMIALGYVLLAGAGIALQRAWVMLALL